MARKKTRQTRKPRKTSPTLVTIDAPDFTIEAAFHSEGFANTFKRALEAMSGRPMTSVESPVVAPEHDFDVMKRIVEHGNPDVLHAFIELATAKLKAQHAPATETPQA